jgi:hypothetical protein
MGRVRLPLVFVATVLLIAALTSTRTARAETTTPANAKTQTTPDSPARDARWAAEMNWQSVIYHEGGRGISLQIEPMFDVADIVYVPDAAAWSRTAPPWARAHRDEILARLKSLKWHRDLEWRESGDDSVSTRLDPIPGSVESTAGGRDFLQRRLFDPGSDLTAAQAREIWQLIVQRFAEATRGEVHLFFGTVVKGSVFEKVALPALKRNPNVKLVWHAISPQPGR